MSLRLVLFCWLSLGVVVPGCGTSSQEDKKAAPKAQVMGHGTQSSGWLGVGVTLPLPGTSSSALPSRVAGIRRWTTRQQAIGPMTGSRGGRGHNPGHIVARWYGLNQLETADRIAISRAFGPCYC
jgi:hypothetical protein